MSFMNIGNLISPTSPSRAGAPKSQPTAAGRAQGQTATSRPTALMGPPSGKVARKPKPAKQPKSS